MGRGLGEATSTVAVARRREEVYPSLLEQKGIAILPDGREIAYKHWPGEGKPVVLIHGLMDSSDGWKNLVERLPGRTIYALDLPGFGASDKGSDISAAGYARDLNTALDILGVDACSLVGHSLGGAVASEMTEERPERFSSLALLAPAGFAKNPLSALALLPLFSKTSKALIPLMADSRFLTDKLYQTIVSNGKPISTEVYQALLRDAAHMEAADGVRAVWNSGQKEPLDYKGPVSVLWGTEDRLVPEGHRKGVRKVYPHSHIELWDDMGHHPQAEDPERLARFIQGHLESD